MIGPKRWLRLTDARCWRSRSHVCVAFGIRDVIVNAHHFADKLIDYLRANKDFGMHVEVSREDMLLDTGGGLKKAAYFFDGCDEPFLLHNVDVISDIDFGGMVRSTASTMRWPHWRCRSEPARGSCCSTIKASYADVAPRGLRPIRSFVHQPN